MDAWINEPIEESDSDSEPDSADPVFIKYGFRFTNTIVYQPELTEEEIKKVYPLLSKYSPDCSLYFNFRVGKLESKNR